MPSGDHSGRRRETLANGSGGLICSKQTKREMRCKSEADESAVGLWVCAARPGGGWSGRQVQQHLLPPPLGV